MKLSTEFTMSEVMHDICLKMYGSIGGGAWLSDDVIASEAAFYLSFYSMNTPENVSAVVEFFKKSLDKLR
jgi:hypothetical protein